MTGRPDRSAASTLPRPRRQPVSERIDKNVGLAKSGEDIRMRFDVAGDEDIVRQVQFGDAMREDVLNIVAASDEVADIG